MYKFQYNILAHETNCMIGLIEKLLANYTAMLGVPLQQPCQYETAMRSSHPPFLLTLHNSASNIRWVIFVQNKTKLLISESRINLGI